MHMLKPLSYIFLIYFFSSIAAQEEIIKPSDKYLKFYCISKFFVYACRSALISTLIYTGYKTGSTLHQISQNPWYKRPILYGTGLLKALFSSCLLIFTCLKIYLVEKLASMFMHMYSPYPEDKNRNCIKEMRGQLS